jgi:hypothetical protein
MAQHQNITSCGQGTTWQADTDFDNKSERKNEQ